MSFRTRVQERDFSGFVQNVNNEIAGIVVDSHMGNSTPVFIQSESDYILNFGKPDSQKWGGFEAIQYVRQSPAWVVAALGTGYKNAGVDVRLNSVNTFGRRTGRDLQTFFNYSSLKTDTEQVLGIGNGIQSIFGSGSITAGSGIDAGSIGLYVGSTKIGVDSSGSLVFAGQTSAGAVNLTSGSLTSIQFVGTPGTVAEYIGDIDIRDIGSGGSIDYTNLASDHPNGIRVNIIVDGQLFSDIDLIGADGGDENDIVSIINTALGYSAASIVTGTGGEAFIRLVGQIGDSALGGITISYPTNITGDEGLSKFFKQSPTSTFVGQTTNSTSPTGTIPKAGQVVSIDWVYNSNLTSLVSHSFFTKSPYNDTYYQLAVNIVSLGEKRFKLTLYEKISGRYNEIAIYTYSLDREKDGFGRSIFIEDVFRDNPWIVPRININFPGGVYDITSDTIIDLTGGNRGTSPTSANLFSAWQNFQYSNTYKCKNFLDIYGTQTNTIKDIVQIYQPYAFGISVIPMGTSPQQAVIYRQALGIDFDGVALYYNWLRIEDPYNNSSAWVSGVGKVGVKYAQMEDVFDGLPPAAIDENNHGGQLKSGFRVLEVERDLSNIELAMLDDAQINPIIFDLTYGPMIYGNRTLQVPLSDTSYIHTRRVYNYVLEGVTTRVLRRQEFKINDAPHRDQARLLTESFIEPLLTIGVLREALVVCDRSNNTDLVLNQRRFILDVYVKAATSSEFVILRFTRVGQNQVITQFLQ